MSSNTLLKDARRLNSEEMALLRALVQGVGRNLHAQLATATVRDKNDGTRSLTFLSPPDKANKFWKEVAAADFVDADGERGSASVSIDRAGRLFELDLLKSDFSPIASIPTPESIALRPSSKSDKDQHQSPKLWRDDIAMQELASYILVKVVILAVAGYLWFFLKPVMVIFDFVFVSGEATEGSWVGAISATYQIALYTLDFFLMATVPVSVWLSAARSLAANSPGPNANLRANTEATFYAGISFLALVFAAFHRNLLDWWGTLAVI